MTSKKISNVKKLDDKFLQLETLEGEVFKRRFKENVRGRFADKVTFNMWDNVYSFKHEDFWDFIIGYEIECEGRYNDIYKKKTKVKREVVEKKEVKELESEIEPEVKKEGPVKHEKFDTIKACIENNIPVYLAGPAGSGKNFTLEQIAEELGMNFYFSNSVQQEYKLTGFIDAGGKFHETEFYKACTDDKECIFFLDEMDASIPEVLVLLNAAIANGYFEFPTGKIEFGNKVHFVSAGNTFGNGADEQYTGRMTLDQATLDRFAVIEFGYSLLVECELAKHDMELVSFIREMREEAEAKGVRATFSYRCITMVVSLKNKIPLNEILKISVFKGMDEDTLNTFSASGSTKYHKALREMQGAA